MIINPKPIIPPQEETMARESEPSFPRLTVKEFDPNYQPRERAVKLGIEALSNSELFAIILRTGTPSMPVTELCKLMMDENGDSLKQLEHRDLRELMQYKGIGLSKALQIQAVMELIRRHGRESVCNEKQIKTSTDLDAVIRPHIAHLDHEEMWVIFLNNALRVKNVRRLNIGSTNITLVDIKRLMKHAILDMASAVVLCHNHPSGALTPSPQDDDITRKVKEACKFMDMRLIDHLILNHQTYFSYADAGRL